MFILRKNKPKEDPAHTEIRPVDNQSQMNADRVLPIDKIIS